MIIIVAQTIVTMEMTITEIDRGRKMVLEKWLSITIDH